MSTEKEQEDIAVVEEKDGSVTVQLPDSASLERTQKVMQQIDDILTSDKVHGVAHRLAISGQSFLLNANGSNFGSLFVILEEFEERHQIGRAHV